MDERTPSFLFDVWRWPDHKELNEIYERDWHSSFFAYDIHTSFIVDCLLARACGLPCVHVRDPVRAILRAHMRDPVRETYSAHTDGVHFFSKQAVPFFGNGLFVFPVEW